MLDAEAPVPRDDGGYYDDADTGSSDGEEAEVAAAEARKGKTLAAAFQQIMQKTRTGKDATAGILVGRKQLAEKELAEEEEAEVRRTKKMRTDMKKRGHVKVPRRGKDPEHDAQEKALTKLATKGVVRLFNAVAKAQQAQRDSALLGKQKAMQSREDFFQQLKGDSGANSMNAKVGQLMTQAGAAQKAHGWSVLNDDFTLSGGTKMKDWDRDAAEEAGMPDEELDDVSGSGEDGGESDSGSDRGESELEEDEEDEDEDEEEDEEESEYE